jgi:hypothetical protein
MRNQKIASFSIGILLLTGLIFIGIASLDRLGYEGQPINQEVFIFDTLEIKGDLTIGQSFLAPIDNLQRIDVVLRNYNRKNTHDVTFYLKQSPDAPEVLYQETFNASEITGSSQWRTFEFPPIPTSAGKSYFFYFASPDSVAGDALTVGGGLGDFYDGGSAYLGPGPARGDLAFRTYYGLSTSEKLSILAQRLVKNKPSIWGDIRFYILLLVLYGLISLRIFVELIKLAQHE